MLEAALAALANARAIGSRIGPVWLAVIFLIAGSLILVTIPFVVHTFGPRAYLPYMLLIASGCGLVLLAALVFPGERLTQVRSSHSEYLHALQTKMDRLNVVRSAAYSEYAIAIEQLEFCRSRYAAALAELQRIRQLNDQNWRRTQLLQKSWRNYRGDDFEEFLFELLVLNGYQVQRTGKTGDHGVDLIAVRNGIRIAIQAKGYPASTVGNDAVQQVHLGREIWNCHCAVVITNSTFTRHAIEAATVARCKLIDVNSLPDLAYDRIQLA